MQGLERRRVYRFNRKPFVRGEAVLRRLSQFGCPLHPFKRTNAADIQFELLRIYTLAAFALSILSQFPLASSCAATLGSVLELGLGVDTGFVNILTLKSVLKLHASTSSLRCHNFLLCLQLPIHASCRFPLLRLDATVPP